MEELISRHRENLLKARGKNKDKVNTGYVLSLLNKIELKYLSLKQKK